MSRKSTVASKSEPGGMELFESGAASLGIHLTPIQLAQFRRYYVQLVEWNSRVNLTSITEWEDVQTRHFLDSLTLALVLPKENLETGELLDVGTGGGFPGLALKIAFPESKLTLMDATAKKTAFLCHVVDHLGLSGVNVITGRAETFAHEEQYRERFDVVTARAVASLSTLVELTLPFCRIGGLVAAQKGPDIEGELQRAGNAIELLGGKLDRVQNIDAELAGYSGNIVVIEKIAQTPNSYPRRPGMPSKRPL